MTRPAARVALFHLVFFLSGVAGLGYQLVWSRMLGFGLGHELPAVLAVIVAFMGGMAAGAGVLDRAISRSRRPDRWYGALEVIVGLWGLLTAVLIPIVTRGAPRLIGLEPSAWRHWGVTFTLPFLVLLPATAAMGATLPAMDRSVGPLMPGQRSVAGLYAANTAGAVAGVMCAAFVLMPALGLRATLWVLSTLNLLCGLTIWWVGSRPGERQWALDAAQENPSGRRLKPAATDDRRISRPARQQPAPTPAAIAAAGSSSPGAISERSQLSLARLRWSLFVTGLLGIGYETVGVRVLSQVLENTIYTFAAVLAVFLLGTALGAAAWQRFGRRRALVPGLVDSFWCLAVAGLVEIMVLARAQSFYTVCRSWFGDSQTGVLGAETSVAAAVFLLPAVLMGAMFGQLAQASRRAAGGVGEALALNTLGGAVAPGLFGVLLLPLLGSKWTLVVISLAYLALLPNVAGWRRVLAPVPFAMLGFLPGNLQLLQLPPGAKLMAYREGVLASVAVVRDATGSLDLRVNNRFQMGGTGATEAERRHALIPLLLHPAPRRALFLGLGTGITLGACVAYPGLRADGVELLPGVLAVMRWFAPFNHGPQHQPRLRLYLADARRFVRAANTTYDVIVADLFHPARDGAGSLYTVEHFQAIRQRLRPGGLFCQWLPLHQLDEPMLRVIVRTFLRVFPETRACLLRFNVDAPVLGLIGTLQSPCYSTQWVERRLRAPGLQAELRPLALTDSIRLFGCLVAGPAELRRFAAHAPLNTDDQPVVTFEAPRFFYQKSPTSYGRLLTLLRYQTRQPDHLVPLPTGESQNKPFLNRLRAFMTARDVYLSGLVAEVKGDLAQATDAYVESARRSADFTAGYARCLIIASLEAKSNPDAARQLLRRLAAAQPARPVANELLKHLTEAPTP